MPRYEHREVFGEYQPLYIILGGEGHVQNRDDKRLENARGKGRKRK
jgi:hypothetical protein